MKTTFNLSEKIKGFGSVPRIDLEDIKEFIKRLKKLIIGWDCDYPPHYTECCNQIDKLAGDKLI